MSRAVLALAAAALLAVGCGEDDADAPALGTTSTTPATETTTTPATTTEEEPGAELPPGGGEPCDKGDGRDLGASYVTLLESDGVDCDEAVAIVTAYHECRTAGGDLAGTCGEPVDGYECLEGERTGSPFQYSARVVCTKGDTSVTHEYTQNA